MSNSYKIGQMVLKPGEKDYTINTFEKIDIKSYKNGNIPMTVFKDIYIIPNETFKNSSNYYLSVNIQTAGNYEAEYQIKLVKITLDEDTVKFEKERIIKDKLMATNNFQNVNLIFNSIEDNFYNAIVFEIIRDENEIKENENKEKVFIGRALNVTAVKDLPLLQTIANLLEDPSIIITELGLQGEPGQLFTIEGEEIRIGKSGVYEMHFENIGINNIGIIPQGNTLILDYKYKEAM